MTKTTQTVWLDKHNNKLIVLQKPGEWYIPLSTINKETLEELILACADAVEQEDARVDRITERRNEAALEAAQ